MRSIVTRVLIIIAAILLLIFILLGIPRLIALIDKDAPPIGYRFIPAAYLASIVGFEKLVNLEPAIPDSILETRNVEYKMAGDKSLQIDFYRLKRLDRPVPLILFIHGGGWKGGKRSDYLVYLVDYAAKGYVTATVSYRLVGDAPYPACAEDISDAVSWLFSHGDEYGYDPGRIAIVGGSAGAHLAMLAAYGWKKPGNDTLQVMDTITSGRIKAIVDIYGPFDLTTEYAREHPLVTNFIARPYDSSPGLYLEASPSAYIDRQDPPTLILHGTSDDLVPISQSDTLKARLDRLGVPCLYARLPLWPHTMDVVERVNDYCQKQMDSFFKEYLE